MSDAQNIEVYPAAAVKPAQPPPAALTWLDGRPRIGIHTSIAGDPANALEIAARIGCTALQIFSGSPRMWPRPHQRQIPADVAQRFRERRAALCLGPVAVHANYLINLAAPDPRQWQNSVEAFRDELIRAAQLGAEYLIVHPGSPRDSGIDCGIEAVAEAVSRAYGGAGFSKNLSEREEQPAFSPPPVGSVRVLFENTAGQGTGLASEFGHLRRLLEGCRARGVTPAPGICLDTAHLLAAGFEIRTPEGLDRTLAEANAAFGLENVCVMHCNDSKSALGSRRDRHEHIGRGQIGRQAFARILNHPLLRSPERAFLAETPIDRPGDDRRNVRALWSLLGLTPPRPEKIRHPEPAAAGEGPAVRASRARRRSLSRRRSPSSRGSTRRRHRSRRISSSRSRR